jgi:hypothetical protein
MGQQRYSSTYSQFRHKTFIHSKPETITFLAGFNNFFRGTHPLSKAKCRSYCLSSDPISRSRQKNNSAAMSKPQLRSASLTHREDSYVPILQNTRADRAPAIRAGWRLREAPSHQGWMEASRSPKPLVYKLFIKTLSRLSKDFIAPHFPNFVFKDRQTDRQTDLILSYRFLRISCPP